MLRIVVIHTSPALLHDICIHSMVVKHFITTLMYLKPDSVGLFSFQVILGPGNIKKNSEFIRLQSLTKVPRISKFFENYG